MCGASSMGVGCSAVRCVHGRLRKNKLHELCGVQFLKQIFRLICKFSAKFGSLNVPIRNNIENIIFIAFKWSKICKYFVNSMLISSSSFQRQEKEYIWVKYLIRAVLSRFQICLNLCVFSAKSVIPKFQSSQKMIFPSLVHGDWWLECSLVAFRTAVLISRLVLRLSGSQSWYWDCYQDFFLFQSLNQDWYWYCNTLINTLIKTWKLHYLK